MDQILTALGNLGGLGLMSAALLYLHRDSIRSFRAELQAERKAHQTAIQSERETCERRHEEILEKLADSARQTQLILREFSQAMRMAPVPFPHNKSLGDPK